MMILVLLLLFREEWMKGLEDRFNGVEIVMIE